MKKFLLLTMIMCLFGELGSSLMAQTVHIGSDGTNTLEKAPFNLYAINSVCQQIYTVAEFTQYAENNTIPSGNISKLTFYENTGQNLTCTNIKVYMKHTDKEAFSSKTDWITDFTDSDLVFDSNEATLSIVNGVLELTLTTPFTWNRTQSILVYVDVNSKSSATARSYFKAFSTQSKKTLYYSGSSTAGLDVSNWREGNSPTTTKAQMGFTFSSGGSGEPTPPSDPTFTDTYAFPNGQFATNVFNPSLSFYVENKTHYKVLLSTTQDFLSDVRYIAGGETSWAEAAASVKEVTTATVDGLNYNQATTYYWKVIAKNVKDEQESNIVESTVYSFTTKQISAPGAIEDAYPNGDENLQNPKFTWTFGTDTEEYQVLIDNVDVTGWINPGSSTTGSYQTSGLSSGEHTWQINARNSAGTTEGTAYTFSVASLPDNVTPISPADGATGVTSATVRFSFAPNTTEYRLLYSDTNTDEMGYISVNNGGTGSTWTSTGGATEMEFTMPGYSNGKTFYWAVDVKNDIGTRAVWKTGDEENAENVTIYSFTTSSVAAAKYNYPADEAILEGEEVQLEWQYKSDVTQYQVLYGTDSENLAGKQDWTVAEGTGGAFTLSDLNLNTKYYWQVNVKNGEEIAYGEIWWFASLEKPSFVNDIYNVYPGSNTTTYQNIQFNGIPSLIGADSYNIYVDGSLLKENLASNFYTLNGINYNGGNPYVVKATAVYAGLGESLGSEPVNVYVSGYASVAGTVEGILGNAIEGATIQYVGTTALEAEVKKTFTFTTDANGQYSGNLPCGTYKATISANNYEGDTIAEKTFNYNDDVTENVTLTPIIPGNVTDVSPADSAKNVSNVATLSWVFATNTNTTHYRVLVNEEYCTSWIPTDNATSASFETASLGLKANEIVTWCVEVKNEMGARTCFINGDATTVTTDVERHIYTVSSVVAAECTSPVHDTIINSNVVTLEWKYGQNNEAEQYRVLLNKDGEELADVTGWLDRPTEGTGFVSTGSWESGSLTPTTKYNWRVDVKKGDTIVEGNVSSFITPLAIPTNLTAENDKVYPTEETNYEKGIVKFSWTGVAGATGYNVYRDGEYVNPFGGPTTTTKPNFQLLLDPRLDSDYEIQVTAVYDLGESEKTEAITVKVIGYANISGFVKNTNKNVIEGATIKFTGIDAFETEQEISTESDENGAYEINIPEGTYVRTVEKEGYFNDTIKSKEYAASNITNDITLVSSAIFTVEVNASINDIDIRLSNNNWPDDANFSGSYNIYYKEDNDKDATGPLNNYFAKEPYSTTLLLADKAEFRTIWTTLANGTYKIGVQQGSNEINWCTESIVRNYSVIKTDGSWNKGSNWTDGKVADENAVVSVTADITIDSDVNVKSISISKNNASLTIKKGCTLTAEEVINEGSPSNLQLEDGAQLRQGNSELNGQFIMNVVKPTIWAQNNVTGWQFISMPFTDAKISTFTNNENNKGENNEVGRYDLYRFDGRVKDEEWINQKDSTNNFETEFRLGYGYLASSEFAETFVSNGNFSTYSGKEFVYKLDTIKLDTISDESNYSRFYLLGNPFSFNMNWDYVQHTDIVDGYATVNKYGTYNYHAGGTIPVGDGFFVKAKSDTPSISYNENVRSRAKAESLNITVGNKDGEDNVVLSFAGTDKEGFPKLDNFNDRIANIFVLDNDIRYGIFNYDRDVEEIELAFVASEMGKYTISIEADGKFETITLVDRFTGIETNMMFEDYTFTATSLQDYNRFIVRLSMNKGDVQEDEHFVYQSGEDLIIDAEGLVQIIDVMGRVVYTSDINGKSRVDVSNFKDASYIVRVVNEKEVKTQKVVIF